MEAEAAHPQRAPGPAGAQTLLVPATSGCETLAVLVSEGKHGHPGRGGSVPLNSQPRLPAGQAAPRCSRPAGQAGTILAGRTMTTHGGRAAAPGTSVFPRPGLTASGQESRAQQGLGNQDFRPPRMRDHPLGQSREMASVRASRPQSQWLTGAVVCPTHPLPPAAAQDRDRILLQRVTLGRHRPTYPGVTLPLPHSQRPTEGHVRPPSQT